MRISALQLAGDLLLKLVNVPSEDNPADAPSRGIVRRKRKRMSCLVTSKRLTEKRARVRESVRREQLPHVQMGRVLRDVKSKVERVFKYGSPEEQRAFRLGGFSDIVTPSSS